MKHWYFEHTIVVFDDAQKYNTNWKLPKKKLHLHPSFRIKLGEVFLSFLEFN